MHTAVVVSDATVISPIVKPCGQSPGLYVPNREALPVKKFGGQHVNVAASRFSRARLGRCRYMEV